MSSAVLSRRAFLQLSAAAVAARIVIPALTPPREPYVAAGEVVSYIGLAKYPAPVFTGGVIVRAVGEWDGIGFPCTLIDNGSPGAVMAHRFYDTDLSNFRRNAPDRFWWNAANRQRYPNVHAYVREQRYGEDPAVMWRRLGYDARSDDWSIAA